MTHNKLASKVQSQIILQQQTSSCTLPNCTFVLAGKDFNLNTSARLVDPTPNMPPWYAPRRPWKVRAGVTVLVHLSCYPLVEQAPDRVGRLGCARP